MSEDPEELLRKAREYVEKHEHSSKRRGDVDAKRSKKDKKRKHSRNREEEKPRRRKDRDHHSDDDDGGDAKDSKRRKKERDSKDSSSRKRSKNGRDRHESDDSMQVDSSHKKAKEASKSKSKDKKRSKDKKSEDVSSKKSSRSRASRRDDDDSSGSGDKKKDKKRQERHKKEKHEHKSKKHKKRNSERHETKSSSSNRKGSEETNKITSLIGPITKKPPEKKISSDDYFTYHNHLRLFLYHNEGVYFEDLSSTETHTAFKTFCDKYNSGELEQVYYNKSLTLPEEVMEACKRTKHKWNFNTNTTEQRSLDLIKSGVKKQTEYQQYNTLSKSIPFPPPNSAMQCLPTSNLGAQAKNNINQRERPKIPERKVESTAKANTNVDKDKQAAMLKMLGLKAGQKITIAPRK